MSGNLGLAKTPMALGPALEAAVELGAVFIGFGVFLANSAVKQASQSLSEGELVHALALFCRLADVPPETPDAHLNPHLRKYLRLAAGELEQHELQFHKLRATQSALSPVSQVL